MPSESGDQKLVRAQTAALFGGAPPPPQQLENLPCPRCDSTNTKFCYYNNYNLSQPRHFCKACRRYWTQGGTLRNVPIGGGTRKNSKRSRAAHNISSSSCSTVSNTNNSNINTVVKVGEGDSHEANGSFTTLLSSQGHGFLGFEDMGFGFAEKSTTVWPYQEVNDSHATGDYGYSAVAAAATTDDGSVWQMSGVEQGSLVEGDCFAWPDLAISNTRNGLK